MAASILLVVVLAVSSALTAGQQNAYAAQQSIAGTLAAEEMMTRLAKVPYASLPSWNGFREEPGTMKDAGGLAMPSTMARIGREVSITTSLQAMLGLGVQVMGRTITVRAFDDTGRTLITLRTFVPQPAAATIPQVEEETGLIEQVLDTVNNTVNNTLNTIGGLLR